MKQDNNHTEIKRLGKGDLLIARQLFALFRAVFEEVNHAVADDAYLKTLLANPAFNCFAAIYRDEVVGGLTAYQLPMYYTATSEMFIYDIAVKSAFQRRGFGKALLGSLNKYCLEKGIKTVFVNADEGDTHALDFYRAADGKGANVVQFTFNIF